MAKSGRTPQGDRYFESSETDEKIGDRMSAAVDAEVAEHHGPDAVQLQRGKLSAELGQTVADRFLAAIGGPRFQRREVP